YYTLISQNFFGVVLALFFLEDIPSMANIPFEIRFRVWSSVMFVLIFLPISMIVTNYSLGCPDVKRKLFCYLANPIKKVYSQKDIFIKLLLVLLAFVSIGSILYYVKTTPHYPLLMLLRGASPLELAQARIIANEGSGIPFFIGHAIAKDLTKLLSLIAFCYWKKTGEIYDFLFFCFLFVMASFILTYDLSKGPILEYFLSLAFLSILIKGRISLKSILRLGFAILALIIVLYLFVMGYKDRPNLLLNINQGPLGRIIFGSNSGIYQSFMFYPEKENFTGVGPMLPSTIASLCGVEKKERSMKVIYRYADPDWVKLKAAGVMNSLFVSEAWTSFGFWGVFISTFYVGFFLQCIYLFFLNMPKNPLNLGYFVFILSLFDLNGGLVQFFYYSNFIFFTIIYFLLLSAATFLSQGKTLKIFF
ncbi:oligosaccharide repeat unit polymerase, partial [bacterium]|nr:oligosaccharide repeat unit polymerase [candidate division CSSED10-310 bacterium]